VARQRVALVSQFAYDAYRHDDGSPFFHPDEFDVTFLARPRDIARLTPGQVGRGVPVDIDDPVGLDRALPELVRGLDLDRVVTTREVLMLPVARVREALGIAGTGVERTRVLRDKLVMKRHFSDRGVRVPEFREITEPVDAAELLDKFGAVVLKPVLGAGSEGVHVVRDHDELMTLQRRGLGGSERYEAEEFISGRQFHLDSVVRDGVPTSVSVSVYLDSHEAFPLGGQIRSHTLDDGPDLDVLLEFNLAVLGCVPWFSGSTHLEAFLDDDGAPVFCEVAGRPGGAGVETAFRYRHGVSPLFASVMSQVGRDVPDGDDREDLDEPATGWSMMYPPVLGRFHGYAALPRADWLLQLTTPYREGDLVGPPSQSSDAMAIAAVRGRDAAEVVRRLAEVKAGIAVSITTG